MSICSLISIICPLLNYINPSFPPPTGMSKTNNRMRCLNSNKLRLEVEVGVSRWYLWVVELIGHAPAMFNLRIRTQFEIITLQIPAMPQSRNYIKVTVQSVSLHFCYNIHNLFHLFFIFCFFKRGGGGGVASHPIQPPSKSAPEDESKFQNRAILPCQSKML